jgi:hypothetical protein
MPVPPSAPSSSAALLALTTIGFLGMMAAYGRVKESVEKRSMLSR